MTAPATMSDLAWELILNGITAASASFAGAYGAWRIANRAERRKAVENEVANCNVAVGLCGATMNVMIALKSQLLAPKIADYEARFQRYAKVSEAHWLGNPFQPLDMGADLHRVAMPHVPLDDLQAAVSKITGNRMAPMLLASARQAVESLRDSVARHNDACSAIRAHPDHMEALYFGLIEGAGADESFPDAIRAMDVQSADCIYFPGLLADVLTFYAEELVARNGLMSLKVSKLMPTDHRFEAVMPNPADYPQFERQFRPKRAIKNAEITHWYIAHTEGLWQRFTKRFF